jgi:hypothetical protein
MKHITICIVLMMIAVISFSQQTTSSHTISSQDYLQKSKHQRNTGFILVGTGLVFEIASVATYHSGNSSVFLLGAGLLSQIASIPFFVSSMLNAKKSKKASLSFNLERTPGGYTSVINFARRPAISLKINL